MHTQEMFGTLRDIAVSATNAAETRLSAARTYLEMKVALRTTNAAERKLRHTIDSIVAGGVEATEPFAPGDHGMSAEAKAHVESLPTTGLLPPTTERPRRDTFVVPEGYHAVRDSEGLATGAVVLIKPTPAREPAAAPEPDTALPDAPTVQDEIPTKEELIAALNRYAAKHPGKQAAAKAAMDKYGSVRVSEISRGDWPSLLSDLKAYLGE